MKKINIALKIGSVLNKCFSWIGKIKKASDSLALVLEHGEMLKGDLDKIWQKDEKNINNISVVSDTISDSDKNESNEQTDNSEGDS